jgi:2'-5' RNA ligase
MRTFIAIEIEPALKEKIIAVQSELKRSGADVKWVAPGAIHLTMKFLGEIDDFMFQVLCDYLDGVASGFQPFEAEMRGVGSFPPRGNPRVVWVGCEDKTGTLLPLARQIEDAAEKSGIPKEDRPFSAHVTVGRVRSPKNVRDLVSLMEGKGTVEFGTQRVAEFVLFKSDLTQQGPIYTVLGKFRLGVAEGKA